MIITAISAALGLSRAASWATIVGLAIVGVGGAVLWLLADAVANDRLERERDALRGRIEVIDQKAERKRDVQELDNDDLLDRLNRWVRSNSADAE